jgi:hypothetical protein
MELRALIIEASNELTEDMCRREINSITVRVEAAAKRNGGHIEQLIYRGKFPCNGLSFYMLVASIIIEIKIVLIDQILDHFVCHPVSWLSRSLKGK